jgi:ABC-type Zn uptake system ZnuABC Zn-binding protein ZnuA
MLPACGGEDSKTRSISVVATTSQLADIARELGGKRAEVHGILEPGADPHDFEARPSDAVELAGADVVLRSGGDVDEWLDELVDNSGTEAEVLTLIDRVSTLRSGPSEEVDPHWWQDPLQAIVAAEAIRTALIEADPEGRKRYERNARRYLAQLRDLDAEVERCLAQVPARARKLVTTHDSLGYFAERYGLEVIGSVIPSLSTQAQPSTKDINALVEQVKRDQVQAVFGEDSSSRRLESAISRETGADVGQPLFTDSLGPKGSPGATYVGSILENAHRLVEGMSGGRVTC